MFVIFSIFPPNNLYVGNAGHRHSVKGDLFIVFSPFQKLTDPRRVGMYGWSYGGYLSVLTRGFAMPKGVVVVTNMVSPPPFLHWESEAFLSSKRRMTQNIRLCPYLKQHKVAQLSKYICRQCTSNPCSVSFCRYHSHMPAFSVFSFQRSTQGSF